MNAETRGNSIESVQSYVTGQLPSTINYQAYESQQNYGPANNLMGKITQISRIYV